MIKELITKFHEVYVNPYSQTSSCIIEHDEAENGIAICFPTFYIALLPSGKWEQREYENEEVDVED